ncbi:glutathione-dependent formaldehyde-activating, GFA [Vibrio harveyi]|uniref:Glutathione-dependent formaldehyde-activating, GFA n=1 Tax=Vibrio harveyi TaxID=669 RepID=A0A454CYD3_VIBHA|nr:glutathione-dependent formaldehyde-activating, GFA [Vibrio harveyi]
MNVRLGILDDIPADKPSFHIFVGSKAPWNEITDELKQFEAEPKL